MWREKVLDKIKEKGYKLTPQRIKLINIINEIGDSHPSLITILNKIREDFPTTSFSTLYSNIMLLRELGLLEIFYVEGAAHIELNTSPHLNIISKDSIRDLIDHEFIKNLEKKVDGRIKLVNIILE